MNHLITTVNPATGKPIATYDGWTPEQIEQAVADGHAAAVAWGQQPLEVRIAAVRRLADELRRQKDTMARLITEEMGKPIGEAAGELEKSAVTALYYADNAKRILADTQVDIDGVDAWISYEPIGMVLAVMPWNFPAWQVMRFAIPAVTCGNGILLKHSPNVTGCALALEKLFIDAGLPKGLLTTLVIDEPSVSTVTERLISDDRIAAVTLTGSNRAGAAVGAAAGRASKKSVLELGGSDAFIVLDDADIPAAAAAAVKARFNNSGQSCVCAKRFIVSESVAEEFIALFTQGVRNLIVGDPLDPATQIGPLARDDLRATLQSQVERSVAAGAVVAVGGKAIDNEGFYYAPTVLTNTGPGMAVFDEETFGPVAAVVTVANDEEAASLANATPFGLSVSIWTNSNTRGVDIAKHITTGAVFINAMTASDPRMPFGGTKKSGYGRELAAFGVLEFTNIRTYWSVSAN